MGIKNLANICYMNSIHQQMFMLPMFRCVCLAFRVFLYSYSVTCDVCRFRNRLLAARPSTGEFGPDSVTFQLQRLFGSLELSARQAYDPRTYCSSFKDASGAPVDVNIQMDAQQYMLAVFDKLAGTDGELLGSTDPTLVDDIIRAGVLNQMMCQGGCGNVVERGDVYYSLPLEVKNMKNVSESLAKLISEEDVADFYCDSCQKKVPLMKKRLVLNKLPPVVVLQCNRFVFNFESMQNEKLNTRYEFPRRLNLEPYTKEGLAFRAAEAAKATTAAAGATAAAAVGPVDDAADGKTEDAGVNVSMEASDALAEAPLQQYSVHPKEYYEYKLKGIVVHNGTADHGHYYSYARDGNTFDTHGSTDDSDDWRTERWLRFDDSSVSDFVMSPDVMEMECFGGPMTQFETDDYGQSVSVTKDQVR